MAACTVERDLCLWKHCWYLCILIVAAVVSGSFDVSIMDDQIQLIEKSSADEKLRDAYGT